MNRKSFNPIDIIALGLIFAIFYFVFVGSRNYSKEIFERRELILSLKYLPLYSIYSILRVFIAFILSFIFALTYGYLAFRNKTLEVFLIPILDVLQSIPVLSFLPPVFYFFVSLFKGSIIGLELASIILIFTGQVWNLVFSFYNSLKTEPKEFDDVVRINKLNFWERFTKLDLPHAAIGLIWNSMMSVAGGWFFLMACENFSILNQEYTLLGLGSFLAKASELGDIKMILYGLTTLIIIIVLIDQFIWRPLIAWSTKFKMEEKGEEEVTSIVLEWYQRSQILNFISLNIISPINKSISKLFMKRVEKTENFTLEVIKKIASYIIFGFVFLFILRGLEGLIKTIISVSWRDWILIFKGGGFTLIRVILAVLIGYLWTIPVGVKVGINPKISKYAQPIAQILASIPATALFPVILLFFLNLRGGLQISSIILMALGTQWYLLFNVIGGAKQIPKDFIELSKVFKLSGKNWWSIVVIPTIFPSLITGGITAWGGAWNSSIVSEYVNFGGKVHMITGLGALISNATEMGDIPLLTASTLFMAIIVVLFNRLFWRRMYNLSEEKYHLE
ncbi:MAG: ABC transporter permease subunit [Caldisericia bacterium]|nr:ABC transporter permease subunit [Caldisericia bacterium]